MNRFRANCLLRFLLMGMLGLSVASCSSNSDPAYFGKLVPPTENALRVGNGAEPRSFDPHRSIHYADGHIYLNIFEGLTARDPRTLEARPALAVDWQSTEGARVWTFRLRRGAVFADGTPITAHDFVWSWRRLVDPQYASPYVFAAYPIRNGRAIADGQRPATALGVSAPDDYTVRVELERPTPIFAQLAAAWAFVVLPRHAIERHGERWARPEHLVASGPFQIEQYRPYDETVLVKNRRYWDAPSVRLDRVYLLPVVDQSQNANLYRAGDLDVVRNQYLPDPLIPALRTHRDFESGVFYGAFYFEFNVKQRPFDNLKVRRAFSLAIDREAIAERFLRGRDNRPTCSVVPPLVVGYKAPPCTLYDPVTARKLLAEAGYPGGRGLPKIVIHTQQLGTIRTIIQAVQSNWQQELGVQVEVQSEESQTFMARIERHDFQVTLGGWIGDYLDPAAFLDLFLGSDPNNHTRWQDDTYAALINRAESQPTQALRLRDFRAAEARLLAETPVAPVVTLSTQYLKKPWVHGWYPDPLGQHQFKYVWVDQQWQPQSVLAAAGRR